MGWLPRFIHSQAVQHVCVALANHTASIEQFSMISPAGNRGVSKAYRSGNITIVFVTNRLFNLLQLQWVCSAISKQVDHNEGFKPPALGQTDAAPAGWVINVSIRRRWV